MATRCLASFTTWKPGEFGCSCHINVTCSFGRAFWADEAAKLGTRFPLNEKLQVQDDAIMRRAKTAAKNATTWQRAQAPRTPERVRASADRVRASAAVLLVCLCVCILCQDSMPAAKGRDADRENRKRPAPGSEEDKADKLTKLAKIQCYKCKKFGHYATKCTS